MEQASAKAHYSSFNWNQSKAAKGSTAVDKLITLVVKMMLSTKKDESPFALLTSYGLIQLGLKEQMS